MLQTIHKLGSTFFLLEPSDENIRTLPVGHSPHACFSAEASEITGPADRHSLNQDKIQGAVSMRCEIWRQLASTLLTVV